MCDKIKVKNGINLAALTLSRSIICHNHVAPAKSNKELEFLQKYLCTAV